MWVLDGLLNAARMAWEVWWALVLGFALSGIVQAWVPRHRIEPTLGGRGLRPVALGTALGAVSSSCSYAAIAIAKSLFQKGSSLVAAMAFQFASTNLVFELGLVVWLFLGWQFTLAEFVGGIVLILLLWVALNAFVSRSEEEEVRVHALAAETGHAHPTATGAKPFTLQGWSDVALNFRGDWQMLWKELVGGFLIAGYVSLLPMAFFNRLFITSAPAPLRALENAIVGPLVAALAFVCSIGNIPLAAVLWSGGISFGGVIAFIFGDLIIIPIVSAYRKYYGTRFALVLTGVMFGAMVIAALLVDGVFSLFGLVPTHRPAIGSITERPVTLNYTAVLNVLFALVFVALFALTMRRGAKDPVCGMTVNRHAGKPTSTYSGRTYFFCGAHCKHTFDQDPEAYT
jgi:uncharacterized protein